MIFIDNKYTKLYNAIIRIATSRNLPKNLYKENHHIIPKCLGGTNKKENLAALLPKEHYLCHLLLTKMTEGKAKSKMYLALLMMCSISKTHGSNRLKISGRKYELIRLAANKANSGKNSATYGRKRTVDEETRRLRTRKLNKSSYKHSQETKDKISAAHTGKTRPLHVKKIMYENLKPYFGKDNNSGKHFYNDGVKNYLRYECPLGCVAGKLQKQQPNYSKNLKWFNDGKKNYREANCPLGCVPGLLKILLRF